jgi:hypothetical protein
MSFAEILETVDYLPFDDQFEISQLINKRVNERKRENIALEIEEANLELISGRLIIQSVDNILDDILRNNSKNEKIILLI